MRLYSTKNTATDVSFEEAVLQGLPEDNGLFMPKEIPQLPASFFEEIEQYSLAEIAYQVSKTLLGDELPDQVLKQICDEGMNFDAPVVSLSKQYHSLELFHGPTLAFKDFGARFMARCMSYFMRNESRPLNILVATSGDTGGAVGHGFLGVPNINVTILYPKGKVSKLQELQLTTLGQNVTALEIDGTFDDCQKMVKSAFLDADIQDSLLLTSANSINISRLVPQSFYYFYAYAQLKNLGRPLVFAVPSGNFGNLCGGLIAWKMGLPISYYLAGTNANRVFTDYWNTGVFEPKPSVRTISNAMDVGNPSNFPRALALFGNQFDDLKGQLGSYSYTDEQTIEALKELKKEYGYVADPHGAIGYLALKDFFKTGKEPDAMGVFLETAHPAKFLDVVEEALGEKQPLPPALAALIGKKKVASQLPNDFEVFKEYLLNHSL